VYAATHEDPNFKNIASMIGKGKLKIKTKTEKKIDYSALKFNKRNEKVKYKSSSKKNIEKNPEDDGVQKMFPDYAKVRTVVKEESK
jgi:hypothetical protein